GAAAARAAGRLARRRETCETDAGGSRGRGPGAGRAGRLLPATVGAGTSGATAFLHSALPGLAMVTACGRQQSRRSGRAGQGDALGNRGSAEAAERAVVSGPGGWGGTVRPVFIGGCHRSGTTLLGAMLGAHPE